MSSVPTNQRAEDVHLSPTSSTRREIKTQSDRRHAAFLQLETQLDFPLLEHEEEEEEEDPQRPTGGQTTGQRSVSRCPRSRPLSPVLLRAPSAGPSSASSPSLMKRRDVLPPPPRGCREASACVWGGGLQGLQGLQVPLRRCLHPVLVLFGQLTCRQGAMLLSSCPTQPSPHGEHGASPGGVRKEEPVKVTTDISPSMKLQRCCCAPGFRPRRRGTA